MLKPSVAKCFNPSCAAKFKKMGEGKLFVQPSGRAARTDTRQVVGLCSHCLRGHTLRYSETDHRFHLRDLHSHRKHIA